MRLLVASHGHCLDGFASAALFVSLYKHAGGKAGKIDFKSCGYSPKFRQVPERQLNGDENAILDFRCTPSPKLTWYFDHHQTGLTEAEHEQLKTSLPRHHLFFDPAMTSCAKLIAESGETHFGWSPAPSAELIAWADQMDSARFTSAEEACDNESPLIQLAAVVEAHGDGVFYNRFVPELLAGGPRALIAGTAFQAYWAPLREKRLRFSERVHARTALQGSVALADFTDEVTSTTSKFTTYALFPDAQYSVSLLRTQDQLKLSVGHNPWAGKPRSHNIGEICKTMGGGGHPMVGAVAFTLADLERAQNAAQQVVQTLSS